MADLRLNRARHYQPWPQSVEQNLCYPISELVVFTFNSDLLSFTFSAISSPINKELTTKKAGVFSGTNLKSGSRQKVVLSLFRVASAPGTVSLTRACWKTAGGDVGLTHVLSSEIGTTSRTKYDAFPLNFKNRKFFSDDCESTNGTIYLLNVGLVFCREFKTIP